MSISSVGDEVVWINALSAKFAFSSAMSTAQTSICTVNIMIIFLVNNVNSLMHYQWFQVSTSIVKDVRCPKQRPMGCVPNYPVKNVVCQAALTNPSMVHLNCQLCVTHISCSVHSSVADCCASQWRCAGELLCVTSAASSGPELERLWRLNDHLVKSGSLF